MMSAAPTWVCRRGRRYAYRKLCDFGRALQDYERALAVGGLSAVQLHTNRAYCLAKLGRFAEALESYDLVLRANPANVHALHNRCALRACLLAELLCGSHSRPPCHPCVPGLRWLTGFEA